MPNTFLRVNQPRVVAPLSVAQLRDRLWKGFSRPAIRQLELAARSASTAEGANAAWALAEWYASLGGYARALDYVAIATAGEGEKRTKAGRLLEAECLIQSGHENEARSLLLPHAGSREGADPDLLLALANCHSGGTQSDTARLSLINQVLLAEGLAPLEKRETSRPLTIDNLKAVGANPAPLAGPKVTVIMPAHDAASSIQIALSGLLEQTWKNLEIVVVDDRSSDSTLKIVEELAAADPRIVLVRHDRNQGVYAARNTGLQRAAGELITVHDSDDWSHPQKIETQVRAMLANPELVGTRTHWSRVSRSLYFFQWWKPGGNIVVLNYSSFMFKREALRALGGWDRVRVSADSEFILRARAIFGGERFIDLCPGAPLSFSLWEADTLTRHSETHIQTSNYGVRRNYSEASKWWHQTATDRNQLRIPPEPCARRFPAPARLLPEPGRDEYDIVIFLDLNASLALQAPVLNWIREAAARARVAVFHWPRFEREAKGELLPSIWSLLVGSSIDLLSSGDHVIAEMSIVYDPGILRYAIDEPPRVTTESLYLVSPSDLPVAQARQHASIGLSGLLLDVFVRQGRWATVSQMAAEFGQLWKQRSSAASRGSRRALDQSLLALDTERLKSQKAEWRNGDGRLALLVERLLADADRALTRGRLSVIDKTSLPPSSDRHDYWSQAPYWWPNPNTPSGLPYIRRDGFRLPGTTLFDSESHKYDRSRAQRLFDDTTILALASYFTDSSAYAAHATKLLQTWFVDPVTRMNPHLRFSQVRLGHRDKGTAAGIIEFKDLYYLLDAVKMLRAMDAIDGRTDAELLAWLEAYLAWLQESPQGLGECRANNNHGIFYDLQVVAVASFVGNEAAVDRALGRARNRIGEHFEPGGGQIHEVGRTLAKHYCAFNLQGWANLINAAEILGEDLWSFEHPNGAGLRQAFRWFLDFQDRDWPFQQIAPFDQARFLPLGAAFQRGNHTDETLEAPTVEWEEPSSTYGIRPHWQLG
jgi:hypothetical protein